MHIMKLLFCAGAEIATASKESAKQILEKYLKNHINEEHILELERAIDNLEIKLTPLKSFILPCGTDMAARLHFARTMVRKAEIALIDLRESGEKVREEILQFFNRLSDYLFVLARFANYAVSVEDITWNGLLE